MVRYRSFHKTPRFPFHYMLSWYALLWKTNPTCYRPVISPVRIPGNWTCIVVMPNIKLFVSYLYISPEHSHPKFFLLFHFRYMSAYLPSVSTRRWKKKKKKERKTRNNFLCGPSNSTQANPWKSDVKKLLTATLLVLTGQNLEQKSWPKQQQVGC